MAEEKESKGKNALQIMAKRLAVTDNQLKEVLKKTVCKQKDGQIMSDVEFMGFIIVANEHNLNPLTKEIYAFKDKNGNIIPVVSTDGWNRLMTTHKDYSHHFYKYAEKEETKNKAKPCPVWCEVHVVKKSGEVIPIREHLDECFRDLDYKNPWQTHTKRMLRHKAKIQGAREAFGFAGIYDADEAARIIEAEVIEDMPTKESSVQEKGKKPEATEQSEQTDVEMITDEQLKKVQAQFTTLKITNHKDKMSFIKTVLNIDVETTKNLSKYQASTLIDKQKEDIQMISKDQDSAVPEKCGPCKKLEGCPSVERKQSRDVCDGPYLIQ